MADRGADMGPALDDLGASLAVSTQRRFEAKAGPGGTAWPPLSPRTLRRRGGNAQPLRKSGRLFQSITHRVEGNRLLVGTNVAYARIHQEGGEIEVHARSQRTRRTTRGKNRGRFTRRGGRSEWITLGAHKIRIPARPFLGFDDADRAMATQVLLDYLGGGQ